MNRKTTKMATMALAGVITCTTLAPSVVHAATSNMDTSVYAEVETALETILKADGVSQTEWTDYINYVKTGVEAESSDRGIASGVKKALKFVIKHLDVIPSKTLKDALKKYGGKVIDVIDTIDTWTWYGIASALTAVGVPDSAADLIADFIVNFLL